MSKKTFVYYFVQYIPIENAEAYAAEHLAFWESIGLRGRILEIADKRGINGISGDYETTQIHGLCSYRPLFSEWFRN